MKIRQLTIKGFRGIKYAQLTLHDHDLIIGANSIGKTTVLAALNFLFGRDRMRPELSEYDFFDKCFMPEPDEDPPHIEISAVLTDFDDGAERGPEARLFRGLDAGRVEAWDVAREQTTEQPPDGRARVAAAELAFFGRYNDHLGEFESLRVFPNPGEDPFQDAQNPVRNEHLLAIGFFFLPTARLWENAIRFTSSTFRKLVQEYDARPGVVLREITSALEQLEPKAESSEMLKQLIEGLSELMGQFVPLAGQRETKPGFEVTRLSMEDVEKSLVLFLRSEEDGQRLPISCQGSGLISLQVLSMLLKFGEYRLNSKQTFILAVEEPELHLYPHLQRQLVAEIGKRTTQSISTTHSPSLTQSFDPSDILLLQRGAQRGDIAGRRILEGEPQRRSKHPISRLFYRQRRELAEALMGRLCLIGEGIAEWYVFPRLSEACMPGKSLDILGVSVVDGKGSEIPEAVRHIEPLVPRMAVLLDGDEAGDEVRQQLLQLDSSDRVLILQLPPEWEVERLLPDGLQGGVQQSAVTAINESAFAKRGTYRDLRMA